MGVCNVKDPKPYARVQRQLSMLGKDLAGTTKRGAARVDDPRGGGRIRWGSGGESRVLWRVAYCEQSAACEQTKLLRTQITSHERSECSQAQCCNYKELVPVFSRPCESPLGGRLHFDTTK